MPLTPTQLAQVQQDLTTITTAITDIKAIIAAPVPVPVPDPIPTPTPVPSGLVQLSDFSSRYKGSFKLPAGKFGYSRRGLAFNPLKNSLIVSTIDVGGQCAEVSIPALGSTASLLSGPVDPVEGKAAQVGGDTPDRLGGFWVRPDGSMIVSVYSFYDASAGQSRAFFTRPSDLSVKGQVAGPFPAIGAPTAKFASGYMGAIPSNWQGALGGDLLTGLCCVNIISTSSYGPSVGAMKASDVGVGNKWNPLVYYTKDNPLHNQWNVTSDVFNGTTEVTGVFFPEGSDTVAFIGRQGIGNYSYGTPGQDAGSDPADGNKGNHAYPYRHQVWLYDAHDFAAVHAGTKSPYQVTPYAYGQLGGIPTGNDKQELIGSAYNPATKTLYVGEAFGDGDQPLIHVYQF